MSYLSQLPGDLGNVGSTTNALSAPGLHVGTEPQTNRLIFLPRASARPRETLAGSLIQHSLGMQLLPKLQCSLSLSYRQLHPKTVLSGVISIGHYRRPHPAFWTLPLSPDGTAGPGVAARASGGALQWFHLLSPGDGRGAASYPPSRGKNGGHHWALSNNIPL